MKFLVWLRIFMLGWAISIIGLLAMVTTALCGFYPSRLYYSFAIQICIGLGLCFVVLIILVCKFVITGKNPLE